MTNKIVAVQGNNPSKLNPVTDTSVFLAHEIQNKNYKIFYYDPKDLSIINSKVIAAGFFIEFNYKNKKFFKILKKQKLELTKCKFILIRQDPPFNLEYISATYILDTIKDKVKILNNPTSIRNVSEKLYSVKFQKYMPNTIFTQNIDEIKNFFKKHKKVILKPIHSYSGNDIGNYNIINQNTHFADITIGNPTISGLSNQTKSFTTSSYTLTGTPSISGLPIVYSSSDTSVATVNSSTGEVTFVNIGSVTISANIVSTLNYNSTTSSYLLEINLNTTNFNSESSSSIVKQLSVLNTRASSSETFNLRTVVNQNNTNVNAKVVVIKDNLNPNVENVYTEKTDGGKTSTAFIDEEEKEKFDDPGNVIDEKTIVLKISDNEAYNYKLEFRQKGLVIKPLDTNSGYFANLNKNVVIKSAITEIKNIAGYLKNQIKTIIFDLANKF